MAPSLIPWCESAFAQPIPTRREGSFPSQRTNKPGGIRTTHPHGKRRTTFGAPHTVLHISCMHLRHLTSAETSRHERGRTKRGPKSHPPQRRVRRSRRILLTADGHPGPALDHGEGQGTGRAAARGHRHPESRRGRLAVLAAGLGSLTSSVSPAVARPNWPADDPAIKKVIGPDGRTGGGDRRAAPLIPQGVN